MGDNIVKGGFNKKFTAEGELFQELLEKIHERDGEISLVSALGVLDLVKDQIKKDCQSECRS